MKNTLKIISALVLLVLILNFTSALIVDSTYITIFPGEEGKVKLDIENNDGFDIEDISVNLILDEVPFTSVGSSEKDIEDIDEDDDDGVTFTLRASTDITPGDYSIPYSVTYFNAEENQDVITKTGTFGLRVSAKTELDFALEIRDDAIINEKGKFSLEIINKGLGDIKSVSVEIFPNGYELLSKEKIFIGTISSDDTDLATFDVIYKSTNPTLSAKITYKDFENNDQVQTVNIPMKVYTNEEALELGLITESKTGLYVGVIAGVLIIWFIYRKIKKSRKKKNKAK